MNKLKGLLFASIMILSIAFVGGAISSDGSGNSMTAAAQTVTVKRRNRPGLARRGYRGGKWVVRKTWNGTKYVYRKVWVATKWTGKKTWQGTKKVGRVTKRAIY